MELPKLEVIDPVTEAGEKVTLMGGKTRLIIGVRDHPETGRQFVRTVADSMMRPEEAAELVKRANEYRAMCSALAGCIDVLVKARNQAGEVPEPEHEYLLSPQVNVVMAQACAAMPRLR